MPITTVGLDADDTLWHCESIFRITHERFNELLRERGESLEDLSEAEIRALFRQAR